MKKLIIAAGIAAAVASFGASAARTYATEVSHASINTMVKGDSVITVTGTNGASLTAAEAKVSGNTLGSFGIVLPASAMGYGISGIHSHGYPDGFKVKFNTCEVAVQSGGSDIKRSTPLDGVNAPYECVFEKSVATVEVVTGDNSSLTVLPGSKTITADFTAYTE
ncbi:hypothetical protein K8N77_004015 [Salmonella enterica]|nr:hypothetical protein [Salmonella enterica]